MNEVTLTAETGRPTGSRASNRLRNDGRIPGVVYGHGMAPLSVTVPWRELRAALNTDAGLNALINLSVGGDTHLTIVKDMQRHPVRSDVTHVDFIVVNRNEAITVDVPIVLEGEAEEVHREQGVVEQNLFSLSVNTTPTNIPNQITIDISGLSIGDAIRVGDLSLPSGVTTDLDAEEPVVVAQVSRAAIEAEQLEAEAAEAAAEAAEGEEGEGAEAGEAGEGDGEGASAEGEAGGGEAGGE